MARDIYQNTITAVQGDGTLLALSGVQVYVYAPGTTTLSTIYQGRTGSALQSNPILTGANGLVEFYADVGEYDIRFVDTNITPRIADRTVQWNSVSGADQGIPTSKLARDSGIDLGALSAQVARNIAQIGQIIQWWRPDPSVPVPSGWEPCSGQTIAAPDHDFPFSGPIQLPDLRNKFMIGADPLKSDRAPSSNGDGTAASDAQHPNAPGIGGIGGSNTSKNLQHNHQFAHTHGVPGVDHTHDAWITDHLHNAPTIAVTVGIGAATRGTSNGYAAGSGDSVAYTDHVHRLFPTGSSTSTGLADRALNGGTGSADRSLNSTTNSQSTTTTDNGTSLSSADMRPQHVGLLFLMKVRRN